MTNDSVVGYGELLYEMFPHHRCSNSLIADVYKCLNRLSQDSMNDVITASEHGYNTQRYDLFVTDRPQTNRYG